MFVINVKIAKTTTLEKRIEYCQSECTNTRTPRSSQHVTKMQRKRAHDGLRERRSHGHSIDGRETQSQGVATHSQNRTDIEQTVELTVQP